MAVAAESEKRNCYELAGELHIGWFQRNERRQMSAATCGDGHRSPRFDLLGRRMRGGKLGNHDAGGSTDAMTDLSVVGINYNGMKTVLDTIESILEQEGIQPRVLVIDDGSTDGSPEAIEQAFPE